MIIPPPGAPGGPPAGAPPGGAANGFELGVWTIHASAVDANFKSGEFGRQNKKVVMTRVGGDVTADRSDGNYKSQLVNLYGHVVMHEKQSNGDYGGHSEAGGQSSGAVDPDGRQSRDRRQSQRIQSDRQRALRL